MPLIYSVPVSLDSDGLQVRACRRVGGVGQDLCVSGTDIMGNRQAKAQDGAGTIESEEPQDQQQLRTESATSVSIDGPDRKIWLMDSAEERSTMDGVFISRRSSFDPEKRFHTPGVSEYNYSKSTQENHSAVEPEVTPWE